MQTVNPGTIVERLRWRYATKKFDASKKIPADQWATLEEAAMLAPSSFGLQPWRFVVVTDPALRARLREVSWNQPQITDASHLVVFCRRTDMTAADVDRHLARVQEVRKVPAAALADYRAMMLGSIEAKPAADREVWNSRQVYIALGFFLATAAMMGIDACPMEGFDSAKYNEILGLPAMGLAAQVLGAAGYRAADDPMAAMTKVRFAAADVIVRR